MPRTKTAARATEQDAALARQIGVRLREARQRAGLTQQQLAGERYTKAYISALETGIARPSMVALSFLSERLGMAPSHFLDEQTPVWTRLEVDMQLASGEWSAAADGYGRLLDDVVDDQARAEVLRGRAEALVRLDRGREAVTVAAESARIFAGLGRVADEALSRYWLAYGLYLSDAEADARSMLQGLLDRVRAGLRVEPEFEMRLLMALAAVESRTGNYAESLAHLEAARGMADDLDDRRRAMFLYNLAISYRETGDIEAAIRSGAQGLALLRAAGSTFESAQIENDLAMAYLATGDVARAEELAEGARQEFERAGDDRYLSAVLETAAQVAMARGNGHRALDLARQARSMAESTGNRAVALAAMLTEARALRETDDAAGAEACYQAAAVVAREGRVASRIREVLREWAGLRADAGDHRGAYELTNEALTVN
jgi:tetratricopeptide (TPR) repeat protein